MIDNLSLRQKILSWAVGIVIAILVLTGAGTILGVRSWLEGDIENMIDNESYDVMRSITVIDGNLKVISTSEWEEHHHQIDSEMPLFIQIFDKDMRLFYPEGLEKQIELPSNVRFSPDEALFTNSKINNVRHRFITRPITHSGKNFGWVVVFMSYQRVSEITWQMILLYLTGFSFLLILVIFTTRYWVQQSLDSIQAISVKARNIQARTLTERIPLPSSRDEVYYLAETLNGMLDRIENSLIATRRFFNNASHEIKTPLAILVAQIEQLKTRTDGIKNEDLNLLDYEINRISKVIDNLGIVSKADYTGTTLKKEPIWLHDLVYDEILRFMPKADQKDVVIVHPEIPSMTIKGDENWIRILLSNLLDNALKFTPENSEISIEFSLEDNICSLIIRDEGPGVPDEDLSRITKRFFRSENAKAASGSGLGLSIAQWVAESHGGSLTFANRNNKGFEVTWKFPA